jgi:hypothetical protein
MQRIFTSEDGAIIDKYLLGNLNLSNGNPLRNLKEDMKSL